MLELGNFKRAGEYAQRSLSADPQRVMSHFVLGMLAQRAGRYQEALVAYRQAEEQKRRRKAAVLRNLHANMADCLARLGQEAEAEREFRAEIEAIPTTREGRVGLATLYRSQGRDQEARQVLGGLIEAEPRPSADSYWTVVRTFLVLGDNQAAREWTMRARAAFPNDRRFRG
jgi:Tfp pilus assembly protein PilF